MPLRTRQALEAENLLPSQIWISVQGALFGVCLLLAAAIDGIIWTWNEPSALFNLLLCPFSSERRRRHYNYKIDRFYKDLTRESLTAMFRSELAEDGYGNFEQLYRKKKEKNRIRGIFERFAVIEGGVLVWKREQFAAFIASHMGNTDAADILWRSLCYRATVPFVGQSRHPETQRVDLGGFRQAVAMLPVDYSGSSNDDDKKYSHWCSFFAFSTGSINAHAVMDENAWQPPQTLEFVSNAVQGQLSEKLDIRSRFLPEVRPQVKDLLDESDLKPIRTQDFAIPYVDMLGLVSAMLQMRKRMSMDSQATERQDASFGDVNERYQRTVAQSIIELWGIRAGCDVSFEQYQAFAEMLHCKPKEIYKVSKSLDKEVAAIWKALIHPHNDGDQLSSDEASRLATCPPAFLVQAMDLLCPFYQEIGDYMHFIHQTLAYSSSALGVSKEAALGSMTEGGCSKLFVVYGTIEDGDSRHTRRSSSRFRNAPLGIFVIVTSSPLWTSHSNRTDDYLVDTQHLLFQLAPRPRALWYTSTNKSTKYAELVSTESDGVISFTNDVDVYDTASGLTIDFNAGIACLRNAADTKEGYVEIALGPHADPQRVVPAATWESKMAIDKIEVYDGNGGVYEDLIVERPKRHSTRHRRHNR